MKLAIELAAAADVERAYLWYMRRNPTAAARFRASLNDALTLMREQPASYEIVYRDARRVLLRLFPYAVYYRVVGDTIVALACMHLVRSPRAWRSRL